MHISISQGLCYLIIVSPHSSRKLTSSRADLSPSIRRRPPFNRQAFSWLHIERVLILLSRRRSLDTDRTIVLIGRCFEASRLEIAVYYTPNLILEQSDHKMCVCFLDR